MHISYKDDIFLFTTDSEVSEEEVKLVQDLIKHIKAEQHTFVPEEKVGTIHGFPFTHNYCCLLSHLLMYSENSLQ